MSDAKLVHRARRGDAAAFAVALGVLGNGIDAEDVTQDAFVRAAERLDGIRETERFVPRPFEPGPEMVGRFREGVMPSMFRALGLTAEQREQIAVIMESGRPRTEVVLDELRAVTDSIRQEIRAVLTAEQAAALDSLETDWRRRLGQVPGMMPGRRGGPSRPPRQTP